MAPIAVLLPARPNPFNPRTVIPFALAEPSHVELAIYDLAGRRVATLVDEFQTAGRREVTWNGDDEQGGPLPPACTSLACGRRPHGVGAIGAGPLM